MGFKRKSPGWYICRAVAVVSVLLSFMRFEARAEEGLRINEIMGRNSMVLDEDGDSSDWVELYNGSGQALDLRGYYLSDKTEEPGRWRFPAVSIGPDEFLIVYASGKNRAVPGEELHTDFRLSDRDDAVILSDNSGDMVDLVRIGRLPKNISCGRETSEHLMYFPDPTPGQPNGVPFSPVPRFSLPGGLYDSSVKITLSTGHFPSEIHYRIYTEKDNVKGEGGMWRSAPSPVRLQIKETSVIRAYAVSEGCRKSPPVGRTYILGLDNKGVPVLSVAADHGSIWDEECGIFANPDDLPDHCEPPNPKWPKRREAQIGLFDERGKPLIEQTCYIQVVGASSRNEWPRPFKMCAHEDIDPYNRHFKYPILKKPVDKFRSFQVRNNNQDSVKFAPYQMNTLLKPTLGMRNPLTTELCRDLKHFEFRDDVGPVLLLINGENVGLVNLGENRDNAGIARENPGVESEDIDMVLLHSKEFGGKSLQKEDTEGLYRDYFDLAAAEYEEISRTAAAAGGRKALDDFIDLVMFIADNDLSGDEAYGHVKKRLDLNTYIESMVTQIIACNFDFEINNIAFWRHSPQGREPGPFRVYNYDFDVNFGGADYVFDYDMLAHMNRTSQMLSSLLRNDEFRNAFIRKYDQLLNGSFRSENALSVVEELEAEIEPWVEYHLEKWSKGTITYEDWKDNVRDLKRFLRQMPGKAREEVCGLFGLSGAGPIEFSINAPRRGIIYMDTGLYRTPVDGSGKYFNDIPLTIKAESEPGYRFKNFVINGDREVFEEEYTFLPNDVRSVEAAFQRDDEAPVAPVVINEIVNSGDLKIPDEDGESQDWIELYNTTSSGIDLGGMYLTDDRQRPTRWRFPDVSIGPGGFLVIFASGKDRKDPSGELHTDFKLSSDGEPVILVDDDGTTVIDMITAEQAERIPKDASAARVPDGSNILRYLRDATPGAGCAEES
ncbi:MAG: hypothetical protein GF392_00750 [Candidatus Omnitrophica bacterium]|nr:hypothetical protein [Candidatus Omnitrophota bacterium]